MKNLKYLILGILSLLACSSDDNLGTSGTLFTDPRDGQTYKLVTLGNQTWFAQNLNFELENGMSSCYDDNDDNCFIYGRLYRGDDALTACPEGYHLPSEDEWAELYDYLGGSNTVHAFLGPYAQQQGDYINFDLLAGGYYFAGFKDITEMGYYWTSTDAGLPSASRYVKFEPDISVGEGGASYSILMNCRCLKD